MSTFIIIVVGIEILVISASDFIARVMNVCSVARETTTRAQVLEALYGTYAMLFGFTLPMAWVISGQCPLDFSLKSLMVLGVINTPLAFRLRTRVRASEGVREI